MTPKWNKLLFAVSSLLLTIVALYGWNLVPWHLAYNLTESLPTGLYFANYKFDSLSRNSLACFKYRSPEWAKGRYLYDGAQVCKVVLGLPGDVVNQEGEELYLLHNNTKTSLGKLKDADSAGRVVPHLTWSNVTIPSGSYYLGSTRTPESFDSRYLGLINRPDIVAQIHPVLTSK